MESSLDAWSQSAAFAALGAGLLLTMVRLLKGPSLPDRVVALDLIGYLAIGFMTVHAIETGRPAVLDVAVVLALFVFLGTVIFGRYLERAARTAGPGLSE